MINEPLRLSNSTIRTWKRCPRSWYLGYFLSYGNRPGNENPTTVATLGTRIHCALEAHYGYNLDPIDALRVIYHLAAQDRPEVADKLDQQHEYAKTMVAGYLDWAAEEGIDAAYEVIATEKLVERQIILRDHTIVTLMAKLDQKVRRVSDGATLFRDFKTVGTLSKAHLLVLDEQMRMYSLLEAMGASETGERVDGGLYTMLLRSKRTPKANGPFFAQVEVSFNERDNHSMLLRVREEAQRISDDVRRLRNGDDHRAVVYPNPGDHCGWACPFTLVCPLMDDGSRWEDALQANFVKRDPYGYYGTGLIDQVRASLTSGMTDGE